MKKNNGIIGPNRPNSSGGNPGMHHLNDQFNQQRVLRWQPIVRFISVTVDKASVSEGGTVTFTVTVEGLSNGSTIYWSTQSLNGTISTGDFVDNATTGSATVAGGVATIVRNILFDGTAEAGDAFRLLIRTESVSGPVVLGSSLVEIIQSTVSVLPNLTAPYSASEGQTIQWTVNTTNIENGTVLYYTIAGTTTADFTTDVNSGSFTINSSTGTFSLVIRRDQLSEGTENYIAQIRQGSVSGSIIATSDPVPISDVSITPTITPSATTVNEGTTVTHTIATTDPSTNIWWEVTSPSMNAADFSTSMSGSFTTNTAGGAAVNITTINDIFTETPSVSLLLLGNGTNGGTTFTDSSPAARTVVLTGSGITTSTFVSKFGGASLLFPGSNTTYLSTANSSAYAFESGDFTIEYWIYFNALPYNQTIVDTRAAPTNSTGWSDYITTGGKYSIWNNPSTLYTSTATLTTTTWYHIAVTRKSGLCRVFINGALDGSFTDTRAYTDDNITIGNNKNYLGGASAYVDDLRITKGYPLYTAAFTAPVAQLTAYPTARESYYLTLRRNSSTGVIVATGPTVTIEDTSFSPIVTANTLTVDETSSNSVLFTVTTSGVPNGTTLYWSSTSANGSIILPGDFADGVTSGSFTINSNQGTVTRQWASDTKDEGGETFVLQIRTLSTTGAIVAESPIITVSDTSTGGGMEATNYTILSTSTLYTTLNAITGVTASNFGSKGIQTAIQNAWPGFNVYAVLTRGSISQMAENLSGKASSNGKFTFLDSAPGFAYNSTLGKLSTGTTVTDLSGATFNTLANGKKWFALANWYNGSFYGIMLWIFTGETITSANAVAGTANSRTAPWLWHQRPGPQYSGNVYWRIYSEVFGNTGTRIVSDYTGNQGWAFTNSVADNTTGYNSTGQLSPDDGAWGLGMGSGLKVEGNSPGPSLPNSGWLAAQQYGHGNYDGADSSYGFYWGTAVTGGTAGDWVGFAFTQDG